MQDGRTAVFSAAQCGHSDVVSLLINAKADINLRDKVIIFPIQSTYFCDVRVIDSYFSIIYSNY